MKTAKKKRRGCSGEIIKGSCSNNKNKKCHSSLNPITMKAILIITLLTLSSRKTNTSNISRNTMDRYLPRILSRVAKFSSTPPQMQGKLITLWWCRIHRHRSCATLMHRLNPIITSSNLIIKSHSSHICLSWMEASTCLHLHHPALNLIEAYWERTGFKCLGFRVEMISRDDDKISAIKSLMKL